MTKSSPYRHLCDARFTRAFLSFCNAGIKAALCVTLSTIVVACPAAHAQAINLIDVQVPIPTSTLSSPYGVAVDGSGNVYIADTGNNRVIKETLSGVTYTESTIVSTGLSSPNSLAVDGIGNIYIADTGNNRVLKETLSGSTYTQSVVDSTLSAPQSIAVDSIGNVYVADTGNNRVLEETLSGSTYTQNIIPTSTLNLPLSIAVDATGVIYISDHGNNRVIKEVPGGGSYTERLVVASPDLDAIAVDSNSNIYIYDPLDLHILKETPSGGTYTVDYAPIGNLNAPQSIAVDPSGNIYVADSGLNQILEAKASGGNFGTVNIGSSSIQIPVTFNFTIGGSIQQPAVLTQGVTGLDFSDAGSGTCTATAYASYQSCTVNVIFTPTAAGTRYGAVVIRSLSGSAVGTAYLQGTGSGPQVSFLPNVQTPLPLNVVSPTSIAEDAAGNLFIAEAVSANSPQNAVVKETRTGSGYTQNTVATGFAYPVGVAVDGAGNVFVADQDATEVREEVPLSGGGYTLGSIFSGMGNVESVAVDGSGNVYIGSLAAGLVKETLISGISSGYSKSIIDSSVYPSGIAVDASGNLYFTQNGNQLFKKTLSAGSYTQSIIDSGLGRALEVGVDGMGNVYIADIGNNQIVKETLSGGAYTHTVLDSGLNGVSGVTVNGTGNVVGSSAEANEVWSINLATPQGLSFAATNIGATSTAQTVTVENTGNASLSFPVPASGNNPNISTNFTLDSTGATACPLATANSPTAGTLAAGASCQLSISFAPTSEGNSNGSVDLGNLTLIDTNLNAAAPSYAEQAITLSGTAPPVLSFAAIPSQTYGNAPFNVSATSASNGAVTYTVASGPATISDSTVTLIGAGAVVLNANQAASGNYVAATATTSFTVLPGVPALSFAAIPSQTYGNAPFNVSATSASNGAVTYTVASGPATISGSTVTLTGAGTVVLNANQAASGNYVAATATTSFTVAAPNFTLASGTSSGSSATATAGGTAIYSLVLTPPAGAVFPDAINFTTSGLPIGATATFTPATVPAGSGTTTVTLTIQTSANQAANIEKPSPVGPLAPVALGFLLLPLATLKLVRRRLPRLTLLIAIAALSFSSILGLSGCSSGSSSGSTPAAKTYTVVVTATDMNTGIKNSTNLTLIVQ